MTDRIAIHPGDIAALPVDAIVNAAGPELARECAALGGCATGEATISAGYRLVVRTLPRRRSITQPILCCLDETSAERYIRAIAAQED